MPRPNSYISTLAQISLLLVITGCGPASDEPAVDEMPEPTDVDPYEAASVGEPPDLQNGNENANAKREDAIVSQSASEEDIEPVEVHLYAEAIIEPASGSDVSGNLRFHQEGHVVHITGELQGLDPGPHGLHVHEVGDCSAPDAASARGHFAPDDDPHGSPEQPNDLNHAGDLGNVTANENGTAEFEKTDREITLDTGENSILGRAVIVHAKADDLGSQPSGAAGERVGCGIVDPDVAPAYTGA